MSDAPNEIRTFRAEDADQAAATIPSSALIHRVRWHTGLTREEFARALRIDLQQLAALERGEARPDEALVDYLTVIDRAPEVVGKALYVI